MRDLRSIPTNSDALEAMVVDGDILIRATGPGLSISLSLTPEAVIQSLEPLRHAAERAIEERGKRPKDNLQSSLSQKETYSVGNLIDKEQPGRQP